ncbi:MAG: C40 family peptidase [Selenomonadaceae bacterium]|nr:C40 family peptidase [Selenomonadaceae bacterium]MBR3722112.1 C40 family peptidase [Selenomonadaceae bacterium]
MKTVSVATTLALGFVLFASSASAAPTLQRNSHGHEVLILQQKLKQIGYPINEADGVYGTETERAVSAFQRDQNIKITGIVTSSTWRALKNTKSKSSGKVKKNASSNSSYKKSGKLVSNHVTFLDKKEAQKIIRTAKEYVGTPYLFGGETPSGFDCSGYLQFIFEKNGVFIPRLADEQYLLGEKRDKGKLVPGDLVFFTTYAEGASHCGLYLGENKFIHTSASKGVRVDELSDPYWEPKFLGGKHIVK